MAGVSVPGGGGGKRALDVDVPLVPFIDLLSSLISFLLMTAVWSQTSRLELKNGSEGPEQEMQQPPPDEKKMQLKVHIHERGFTVIEQTNDTQLDIPCTSEPCFKVDQKPTEDGRTEFTVASQYDYTKLQTTLEGEIAKFTNPKDVSIVLADKVPYNEMIKTMDTCLVVGLDGVSLSGTPM